MKQKDYLILFIPAIIVIILWVIFNIYHNYTTSTVDFNQEETVIPIEGKFDTDTINQIKNRKQVVAPLESELVPSSVTPSVSPAPSPSPTQSATGSSQLSPTLSPTP